MTDTAQCTSTVEFIVKPREKHMLFTDLVLAEIRANSAGGPHVYFETVRPCHRRCFNIYLQRGDVELMVTAKATLSLLMKLGFLKIEEFTVTRDLWAEMLNVRLDKMKKEISTQTDEPPPSKRTRTVMSIDHV